MTIHLVVSRAYFHEYDQITDFIAEVERARMIEGWTATRKFARGDCIVFYFTKIKAIMAVGFVASDIREVTGPYKWTDWEGVLTVCDYKPVWLLENPVHLSKGMANTTLRKWHQKKPYRRSHQLSLQVSQAMLDEIVKLNPQIGRQISGRLKEIGPARQTSKGTSTPSQKFIEGGIVEVTQELARRDPQLRAHALAKYGYSCEVCGFNFEEFYGKLGAGYIEMHHLIPLSERKRVHGITVDGVRMVCANCHRVLHKSGKTPLSIKVLKSAVKRQKTR